MTVADISSFYLSYSVYLFFPLSMSIPFPSSCPLILSISSSSSLYSLPFYSPSSSSILLSSHLFPSILSSFPLFHSFLFSSLPQLLNKDPKKRISIEDAFAHPFLQQANSELTSPKAEASLEVVSGQCNTIQYNTIQERYLSPSHCIHP